MEQGITLPPKDKLWKPLSKDEVKQTVNASLKVLDEVGIHVDNEIILKSADDNGCTVDYHKKLVHFPDSVVNDFINKVPNDFLFAGRTEEFDVAYHGIPDHAYGVFGNCLPQVCFWDDRTSEYAYRDAIEADLLKSTRLYDALENVHLVIPPTLDMEAAKNGLAQHVHELNATLSETRKHINLSNAAPRTLDEWDYYARLASEVVGGDEELRKRPIISGKSLFSPTLRLSKPACHNLLGPAKHGLPVILGGCNMPLTIPNACNMVLQYSSILANVTLAQMLSPDIHFNIDVWGNSLHLTHVTMNIAAPENEIVNAALVQMVRDHLRLPVWHSPYQSAKITDIQCAYEATLALYTQWVTGVTVWTNYPGNDFGYNPEMLIFHEELAEYFDHMGKRFKDTLPTEENIAFKAIKDIGPLNDFFTHEVTLRNMDLQYTPKLADYRTFTKWNSDKKSMLDRIRERIKELEVYMPPRLPKDVTERMKKIVKEADRKLAR